VTGIRRVGLLVPSSNTVMEPDLYRSLPQDVTLHTARMYLEQTTPAAERIMLTEHLPRAAAELATLRPDLVIMGCTSAGALVGPGGEREMCRQLSEITGGQVISVMAAVQDALRRRGWHHLLVLTPYIDQLNPSIKAGLEASGLSVVKLHGMGIRANMDIGAVTPEEIVACAKREFAALAADGLFVSCTNLRSLEAARALEQAVGLPVLASNGCVIEATAALLADAR